MISLAVETVREMQSLSLLFHFFSLLLVCSAEKLTNDENEQRIEKCGGGSYISVDVTVSKRIEKHVYISPHHYLTLPKRWNHYNKTKCLESSSQFVRIGECGEKQLEGFLLGDSDKKLSSAFACISSKKPEIGTIVSVETTSGGEYQKKVIECNPPREKEFCLEGNVTNYAGPIFQKDSHVTLIGMVRYNHGAGYLVGWSISSFSDEICETSGVCEENEEDPTEPTTTSSEPTTPEPTTPEPTTLEATTTLEEPTSMPTTEDVTTEEPTTTPSPPSIIIVTTTTTTSLPDHTDAVPSIHNRTEKHRDEKNDDVKKQCGDEYLCWEEDVFRSTPPRHLNLLLVVVSSSLISVCL